MTTISFDADSRVWEQIDPGTSAGADQDQPDAAPEFAEVRKRHRDYAIEVADSLQATTWLFSDASLGLAAAVIPVTANGPESLDAADAGRFAEAFVGSGTAEPIVTEVMIADLPGHLVTLYRPTPPELTEAAEGTTVALVQQVFVAADGAGVVRLAAVSPQVSTVAGFLTPIIAAWLNSMTWHD